MNLIFSPLRSAEMKMMNLPNTLRIERMEMEINLTSKMNDNAEQSCVGIPALAL